jgi:hypothetical protein
VFKYKLDKHKNLQKCKARLVVCGNQQAAGDLPTRATVVYCTCVFGLIKMKFRRLIVLISDDVFCPQGKKANLTEFS